MRKIIFLLSASVYLSTTLYAQLPFTKMVVFGDSLSDNGNLYYGTSLLGDPTPGPPGYATGEYTDGTNSVPSTQSPLGLWIEQLAPMLNLPVPQPFAKGGLNYAVAGALTGHDPSYTSGSLTAIPWSTDQVGLFLAANPTAPSDYLYVFWCGSNDLLQSLATPAAAVANVQANIQSLVKAGAKYFLWLDLPPLGEVPEEINTANLSGMDAASVAYNTAWAAAITQLLTANPGITIAPYDIYLKFVALTANPSLYGFSNINSRAQGLSGVNPNTYLFWDMLHPTTAGHAEVASGVDAVIRTVYEGLPGITTVVNAFGDSPTIAPNTWVAVKGAALSPTGDARTWATSDFVNNQMPTALDGVSVTLNGENAYIEYISGTQVNILTPPNLASGPVSVQLTLKNQTSETFLVQAEAISPSFFAFDGTHVVATHLNYTDVGPTTLYPGYTTPAQPGEQVVLYANGFGVTSVPIVAGASTQSGNLPTLPVVMIGNNQATVVFAGLVSPGLYQFNAIIPMNTPNGDIPLTATYNGNTTQTGVVITVQQ